MLDEFRELAVCTYDLDEEKVLLNELVLQLNKGKNDFTCLPWALELIARYCLFYDEGRNALEGEGPSAERVQETIAALQYWWGTEPSENEDASSAVVDTPMFPGLEHCHGWMKRYLTAYCETTNTREWKPLKSWRRHCEGFDGDMFSEHALKHSNHNETSFQLSVARAFRRGPLKRWCLAGKLSINEDCRTFSPKKKPRKMQVSNNQKLILLTAYYLLGLEASSGEAKTGFVPINVQRVATLLDAKNEESARPPEHWFYKGEPFFVKHQEQSGVQSYQMNHQWLEDGEWQLIDITDNEDELDAFRQAHPDEGFRYYKSIKDIQAAYPVKRKVEETRTVPRS